MIAGIAVLWSGGYVMVNKRYLYDDMFVITRSAIHRSR